MFFAGFWFTAFLLGSVLPTLTYGYVGFTNPLKDPNGSDPFMVYDDGYYYLTTTT